MIGRRALAWGGLAPLLARPARAAWPERPLRIVVPFAAGGNVDVISRLLAPALSERLGQPVVVENRPGAGGSLGAEQVARAAPDGHTILAGSNGPLTVNPLVQARLPYDPARDFAPVALVSAVPLVLMLTAGAPERSVAEVVARSRAAPGSLTTGTAGVGSSTHLAMELFNAAAGAALAHVPYRGSGAVLPDIVAGNLRATFTELPTGLPIHREGRGRIIGVAAHARSAQLPDVPTFIEAGLPGFVAGSYYGLLVPRGTPGPVVAALREALSASLSDPGVRTRLEATGAEIAGEADRTPEGFAAHLRREAADARRAADLAGLKPE